MRRRDHRAAAAARTADSAATVLASVISPRSSAASISARLTVTTSRNSPSSSSAPTCDESLGDEHLDRVRSNTTRACGSCRGAPTSRPVARLLAQLALRGCERRSRPGRSCRRETRPSRGRADSGTAARRRGARRAAPARSAPRPGWTMYSRVAACRPAGAPCRGARAEACRRIRAPKRPCVSIRCESSLLHRCDLTRANPAPPESRCRGAPPACRARASSRSASCTSGGIDIRIDSVRPPDCRPNSVPRSQTRLNST